jgi:Asp-tRNA(Asn)/Glu-tRNA(Gln) amidotransferase C subunit
MMKITAERVRYVAALARLELAPARQQLTGQLNAILEYMGTSSPRSTRRASSRPATCCR